MLDHEPNGSGSGLEPRNESASDSTLANPRRRRAASRPAGVPTAETAQAESAQPDAAEAPAPAAKRARAPRKTAAKKAAAETVTPEAAQPAVTEVTTPEPVPADVAESAPAKRAARKTTRRKAVAAVTELPAPSEDTPPVAVSTPPVLAAESAPSEEPQPAARTRRTRKRATAPAQPPAPVVVESPAVEEDEEDEAVVLEGSAPEEHAAETPLFEAPAAAAPARPGMLIFQAPVVAEAPVRRTRATAPQTQPKSSGPAEGADQGQQPAAASAPAAVTPSGAAAEDEPGAGSGTERESSRRRRRGRNGKPVAEPVAAAARVEAPPVEDSAVAEADEDDGDSGGLNADGSSRRRRRRRRRQTADELATGAAETDDPPNTVVRIREPREPRERRSGRMAEPDSVRTGDDVLGVRGSVRLAAKQQRRRDGRSTRSRRAPIVSEAEFLARRESVERIMVVRQAANRTQIGVLEDGVLVEHYVNRESSVSYVGNVYLGKVQNVLPSMEAAFVDINKGRNAVLYAGEVNFSAAGLEGQPKRIESALKSGQPVLVQVTKDPIGHKGARLTSQISLPGRFLVYIPGGSMMGISRKLPDNERTRLKQILKKVVPEDGGVIVRTAAEGASEQELSSDVERLVAQWEEIERRSRTANAPALLYGEPDLTVRVIRDIFNEDFSKLIVSGDEAYKTVHEYLHGVAPELASRLEPWTSDSDIFTVYRVDEQLAKGLDRKVWLPSGGSLVIDRTEAMVVIDVNTGKFTGQGSNSLEETVTRNNLEAAEEIVRQLRLRDLGGIIVIDFIDMVLESNRELVLRRLLECLGRDRTKHQVAEVTSLGLVQMTRKRVGQGLLEAFSETCDHCNGRGIIVHMDPVDAHGRGNRSAERPAAERTVVEHIHTAAEHTAADRAVAGRTTTAHGGRNTEAVDEAEDGGLGTAGAHHAGSAAESRANRRRRRKGKHHDGEDAPGTAVDAVWTPDTPGPGSAYADELGEIEAETEDVAQVSVPVPANDSVSAPVEPPAPLAPINLKAHAEDPDSAAADDLGEALSDTGRPRKRRRAASRPAGSPQSAAEAS